MSSTAAGAYAAIGVSIALVVVAVLAVFGFKLVQSLKSKPSAPDENTPMSNVAVTKPGSG